ncbi:hypothetical protein GO013_02015 [Pseudodesulfovibrio sp. JC047]|uniref:hypothetical protein n=1 Tax=Pseudodesulfovibrio sp. JC047 TaxID=2683199 RepID=UPI0013D4A9B0|nr:hypothetical protein [Pseudodesulfovibrio sp. JC047]NDV18193.1 hypothetical protein [Pseudodesulfovibrio sp. JC047]
MTDKNTPVFPIFIFEGHDISVFLSSDNMSNYLEHYDVMDSLFVGYDFEGRLLDLYVEEDMRVQCKLASTDKNNPELLQKLTEALTDTPYHSLLVNNLMKKIYAVALFTEKGFK